MFETIASTAPQHDPVENFLASLDPKSRRNLRAHLVDPVLQSADIVTAVTEAGAVGVDLEAVRTWRFERSGLMISRFDNGEARR